jgi:Zn-dependent peptidase ImmA (M78 family)
MTPRQRLAKNALAKSCRVRREVGLDLRQPVCVFDLAQHMGVDVWFTDIASMEGTYSRVPRPTILLSSLRPPGRQAFTCGHELGHHVYGHGFRIDQLVVEGQRGQSSDDEFLVDCFSGFLLMPRPAVDRAFEDRGFAPSAPTPLQVFTAAGWLGVGYETLITHMQASLGLLNAANAATLRRTSPKSIKTRLVGEECQGNVVVVDPAWADRTIDVEVGDLILTPAGVVPEGAVVEIDRDLIGDRFLKAATPGVGRLIDPASSWSSFVRVSKRDFVGWNMHRHRELDEDDDDPEECAGG